MCLMIENSLYYIRTVWAAADDGMTEKNNKVTKMHHLTI